MKQVLKLKSRSKKSVVQFKVMLATSDVARLLNVHINTVRLWSNQGVLKSYRISSRGDRRFKREDVDALIREDLDPKRMKGRGPRLQWHRVREGNSQK